MASASSTPAMVACTPDSRKHTHMASPMSTYGQRSYTCSRLMTSAPANSAKPPTNHAISRSAV